MMSEIASSEQVDCALCTADNEHTVADCLCVDCSSLLCVDCRSTHDDTPALSAHYVVDIPDGDTSVVRCHTHNTQYVRLYCVSCSEMVCHLCLLRTHQDHKTRTLREAIEERQVAVTRQMPLLSTTQEELIKRRDMLSAAIDTHNETYQHTCQQILIHSESLLARILQQRDATLKTLNKAYQTRMASLTRRQEQITSPIEDLEAVVSQIGTSDGLKELTQPSTTTSKLTDILSSATDLITQVGMESGDKPEWRPEFLASDNISIGTVRLDLYSDVINTENLQDNAGEHRQISTSLKSKGKAQFSVELPAFGDGRGSSNSVYIKHLPWRLLLIPIYVGFELWWGVYIECPLNVDIKWSCKAKFTITLHHPSDKSQNRVKGSASCTLLTRNNPFSITQPEKVVETFEHKYNETKAKLGIRNVASSRSQRWAGKHAKTGFSFGSTLQPTPVYTLGQSSYTVPEAYCDFSSDCSAWGHKQFIRNEDMAGFKKNGTIIIELTLTAKNDDGANFPALGIQTTTTE